MNKNLKDNLIYATYDLPTNKPYSIENKLKFFHEEWRKVKIKKFRRCLDIGSHIGIYAYQYSKIFNYVESFEPIPKLYNMLYKNTKNINSINTHNVAVSDNNEGVLIYENPRNTESNVVVSNETEKLINSRWGKNKRWFGQKPREVKSCKIDDYNFHDVDFIKIDTEGYVKPILNGMIETLKNNSPILQIEVTNNRLNENKFLNDLGYVKYDEYNEDDFYMKE